MRYNRVELSYYVSLGSMRCLDVTMTQKCGRFPQLSADDVIGLRKCSLPTFAVQISHTIIYCRVTWPISSTILVLGLYKQVLILWRKPLTCTSILNSIY
jgi:hypothetical protein